MERGEGAEEQVRIEAVASGGLAGADRIYVVTRGNQWQDSAAEEFYEEGQDG